MQIPEFFVVLLPWRPLFSHLIPLKVMLIFATILITIKSGKDRFELNSLYFTFLAIITIIQYWLKGRFNKLANHTDETQKTADV